MKKTTAVALLALTCSLGANAGILERFMKNVFTSYHGEGMPRKVGERREAIEYRQRFMDRMGITEFKDELGLSSFENNDSGLALIKKGNDDEAAFNTVLNQRNYSELLEWKNGPKFIKALKEYTQARGCIPKIVSVSHGWRSSERTGEGSGLSGTNGINGIYATDGNLPSSLGRLGTRSLDQDLAEAVRSGEVKFCDLCVAQFYACNVSAKFAKAFAKVSGCQSVVATGQNSPYFQTSNTELERARMYKGAHYWLSAAGVWEERQTSAMEAKGEKLGTWYRATPIKDASGRVTKIIDENLGDLYISL